MENQDKFFDDIKKAADNAESREFPGLESVWSRVEDKLDNKVLAKQNRKWKQWAVAASVVAIISLGYQAFRSESEPPAATRNEVVIQQQKPEIEPIEDAIVTADTNSVLRKDASRIFENIRQQEVVRSETNHLPPSPSAKTVLPQTHVLSAPVMRPMEIMPEKEEINKAVSEEADDVSDEFARRIRSKGIMAKGRVFEAKIVTSEQAEKQEASKTKKSSQRPEKQKPLLIVDGAPLLARDQKDYDRKLAAIMESVPTERDTIFYLKEPLYVIDGKEYTEESLFGPSPTSPYAPINLQEEGMKTRIYTGKDAVKRFGEKGRNGVVVITTKNGAPRQK